MGWNSWNAFGGGNTEALTKAMADAMTELGLDRLGCQYLVLDDGCYRSERIDGKLANETVKFPHDFKSLADYIHAKGLNLVCIMILERIFAPGQRREPVDMKQRMPEMRDMCMPRISRRLD